MSERARRITWPMVRVIIAAAPVLLLAVAPDAAADSITTAEPGYVLPGTETWELSSGAGEVYRIFVSLPAAKAPAAGYPVLYVLDGNAHFAGFAEARRVQEWQRQDVGTSIVVAVGYPTDQPYDTTRRRIDYTSPVAADASSSRDAGAARVSGQERFLDFVLNRLRTEVATRYPVDPKRQALFGHSFGGLFALHVLYTRPDAFSAIIAASPSQWWNDQAILGEERAFADRLTRSTTPVPVSRLLLLAGDRETSSLVWDAEALAARLQPLSAFGLRSRFEMLSGETHITVPSRAVTTALRFAFGR